MSGRNRFIHDDDISLENSGFIHIICRGAKEKAGIFPDVQNLVKIDAWICRIGMWDRETLGHDFFWKYYWMEKQYFQAGFNAYQARQDNKFLQEIAIYFKLKWEFWWSECKYHAASGIQQNPVSASLICATVRFQGDIFNPIVIYSLPWCFKHTLEPVKYWRVCHKCRFVRPGFLQSGGWLSNTIPLRRE